MKKQLVFLLSGILVLSSLAAEVRLPRLIQDGMVLQRDQPVKLWGWATPGENVVLQFKDQRFSTSADARGKWMLQLPAQPAGGPSELVFQAGNTVRLKEVYFGDVWICSGQSNMELPMERVQDRYPEELAVANYPEIRQFIVPDTYNFNQWEEDLESGQWQPATAAHIRSFSAVAYFFAKALYQQYKVPIGLINSALGGSPAEAWLSEEALKAFPAYYEEAQKFKSQELIAQIQKQDRERAQNWYQQLQQQDEGLQKGWRRPDFDDSGWSQMDIPGYWADGRLGPVNGVVWFRRTIELPASWAGKPARLLMGRIVDADSVFINGQFVGAVTYQYPPRRYDLAPGILKKGKNSIVVRVVNSSGRGGFVADKPYELQVGEKRLDLKGPWKYRLGARLDPLPGETFIRWKPGGLFNAMIAPLLNYGIKGVIWYQGESNTKKPEEYAGLMKALVADWRSRWTQGDFPFLYVQLANYQEARPQPGESAWAALRQAQLELLRAPNTGMAVAIDLGEWNDIHPLNKKDVGERLALQARKLAYGEKDLLCSGPLFQDMSRQGSRLLLHFAHTGSGLEARGGALKSFALAGADGKFVWANAEIQGQQVAVWNDAIPEPMALRYAWADNPDGANLYNKEGLPASPFEARLEKGLKDYYRDYFPIGVAVHPRMMEPGEESALILREFSSMTAENVMKMGPIHPEENRYNWAPADKIVEFAGKNGLKVRGHALCWHQQAPDWFFTDAEGREVSREVLLARLKQHISEVMGRYKGRIYAWDVVNEAISDDDGEFYRRSKFYEIIGEDYIELCFRYAHEVDPSALLFYNDYNTESPGKRERILRMVKQLQDKGVPIHGVGLQGHWSIYEPSREELETSITRVAALGLQVHITELDVSVYPKEHQRRERRPDDRSEFTPEMEEKQAAHYQMLFEVFRQHRDKVTNVTFWNLSDKSSWLDNFPVRGRKDYPLLFDQQFQRKKAYERVVGF